MKVLLYSGEFPPENGWGGIATYTYYMALGLSKLGHDVTVMAQSVTGKSSFLIRDGLRIYRYKRFPTHYYFSRLGLKSKKVIRFLSMLDTQIAAGLAMAKAIKLHGIEIVEYPDSYADGLLHKFFCKTPYVVKCHVPSFTVDQIYESDSFECVRSVEMSFLKGADAVTAPSQCVAGLVKKRYAVKNIRVIQNPIDVLDFPPSFSQGDYILFTGWISPVKGIDVLIKSIPLVKKQFPYIKFKIVGNPMDVRFGEEMKQLSLRLGVEQNIEWAGRIDRNQLPFIYQKAIFCVLPSRWENFPYSILEAFSSRKPVVATNVGGIPELVVDRKTGILVEPSDFVALGMGIINLLKNPSIIQELGQNARSMVEKNNSMQIISKKTISLYQKVLTGAYTN